jgi:hypothetical protein
MYVQAWANAVEWAKDCTGGMESKDAFIGGLQRGVCYTAVANLVDAIEAAQQQTKFAGPGHRLVCWPSPPNTANVDDPLYKTLVTVALTYLHDHQEYSELPPPALMLAAFMRKWPCADKD